MQSENRNDRINEIIESALKNMNGLIDVDTVIGSPIRNKDDDLIIPVSKVTFGLLTGGGEYGKINLFKTAKDLPHSGGNGTVVSVKPCGFLIKNSAGEYRVLSVGTGGVYENLLEKTADFIVNSLGKDENEKN